MGMTDLYYGLQKELGSVLSVPLSPPSHEPSKRRYHSTAEALVHCGEHAILTSPLPRVRCRIRDGPSFTATTFGRLEPE